MNGVSKGGRTPSCDVALFLPSLEAGGAEAVMVTLANAFASMGLRVDLVPATATGAHRARVTSQVRVEDLGSPRIRSAIPKLRQYLANRAPRAMLSTLSHANVAAVLAARSTRWRGRLVLRQADTTTAGDGWRSEQGRVRFGPTIMRLTYPLADAFVAVSEGVKNDLRKLARLDPDRIFVVPNPTVTPELFKVAALPSPHPWLGEGTTIVSVGRLDTLKDQPTLLRAFAKLREQTTARLILVGEGSERPRLEALVKELHISDSVDLVGYSDRAPAFVARADLFVLSSRSEGSPNALIEAVALGTRVVSTDCESGPREILRGGELGPLVPVGDSAALAAAMRLALSAPHHEEALRLRGLDYSSERSAEGYLHALGLR